MGKTSTILGKSVNRIDAYDKVTGKALYPGDLSMPGMLHMKVLFAERPHSRIISIDTSQAKAMQGVVSVYTATDVPVNEYGLQKPDQPVLCGPGSKKAGADVVRFVGDQIALVIAESAEIAEKAKHLIQVDFEDLSVITDPLLSMRPDSPLIHPEMEQTNICVHDKIRKGDIEAGFKQADVIIEGEYDLPFQEHVFMEPEAGLAYMDEEKRITVMCAGQWTHTDREQIAHALDLPLEKIRVIYPAIGGAFGGREDMSVQIILALAAWKTGRPVKVVWSRRESFIGHGKRHPMHMKAKWGASKDGLLVAAQMEIVADAGAYMYTTNKVLGNATIVCTGPYFIPNVHVDAYGVYTNNIPGAAFRGFGAPQGNLLAEMQMNKLADALKIDPVQLRLKNALKKGDTLDVGTAPMDRITISQVIQAATEKGGWKKVQKNWQKPVIKFNKSSNIRRGIGFAAGFKNIGFSFGYKENCWSKIELHGRDKIENVILYHAGADVGQGAHTVFVQMAAEALNVPVEKITIKASDTASSGNSGSASASRMTFMAGNAIRGAAEAALKKWKNEERPAVAEYTYLAPPTTPFDKETGHAMPNFAYAYAAQAVEVEVNIETGNVHLVKVISAHDVGKTINPQNVKGQIEGGVVQAAGYALLENFIMREGRVITDGMSTYLIPTIMDIPDQVESVILETPDSRGPWGARGVGELPFLPLAPAVLAAIKDALGVWINRLPATPEVVLDAIEKNQGK